MTGCGRSRVGKAIVAAFMAALGCSLSTAVSEAAGNPFDISIQAGYHSAYKLGEWMPVTIDVTNRGQQVDGTLEVQAAAPSVNNGGVPAGTAIYQTPLSLAPGATKHVRTYVSEDVAGNVEARIVQGGRVLQRAQIAIATTVSGLLVGVLSDDTTALDAIATVHPGGVAPTVVHLLTAELSDSPLVLRAFDLIALDDYSSDTLTLAQRAALADYVMQGGSLFLSTGGSWHKTLAGLPAAIVPMQVGGSTVIANVEVLGGVPNVEIATGALSPGVNAWLSEGGRPLLIESPVGAGWVAMSTFDWAQRSIVASTDATALLRQTVVRTTYGNAAGGASIGLTIPSGNISNSVASRGGTLSQALGNVPALDLPAWWLIGSLVLVYVLLVGPINYFVMRAIGRRALAWITVPAIALVASGGAYGASLLTKGTSVLANEISIVHTHPGWDRAYREEYTGIVTPTRGDYEIGLGGRGRLISPIDYNSNPNDASFGLLRVNTATGSIALPSMTAFTLRGFATEDIMSTPSIIGTAQLAGGRLTGTVKNASSLTFTDGVIISGGAYQTIGRLAPGETERFSLVPQAISFGGPPPYMSVYPNALCCSGPIGNSAEVERQNETRASVLSSLSSFSGKIGIGGGVASTGPIAVLWTRQPFEEVSVNGAQPRTYVESAVVLDLPPAQVAPGALPAGIVNGRLIDITAAVTPAGPPGLVVANSGSVVYSFQPALATGSLLSGVTIASSNPFGAKFVGPNGPGGVVNGQAWDWLTSSWMNVKYVDGGTTSVPQDAVNPATGEVRLKVSSDGQFSAGFLSIAGTVS